ncbi:MAG: phosphoribosyl-AMP cyclohydrolase [Candidatus Latescibacterota bacterium]
MATDHRQLEEGLNLHLDFEKLKKVAQTDHPVIPVAVQDADTKAVLLIGYVNELALQHTLKNRVATFWSTSRNELWIKGATSGDVLELVDVRVNCEQNSLLYIVRLNGGGSCHTKKDNQSRYGCYYRSIQNNTLIFTDPKTIPE